MSRSADIFNLLQATQNPLTCQEITAKCGFPKEENKNVAATLAMFQRSGVVVAGGSRICLITNHMAKTYLLVDYALAPIPEPKVEEVKQVEEIHQKIENHQVVVVTFEDGKVRIDAYSKPKNVA